MAKNKPNKPRPEVLAAVQPPHPPPSQITFHQQVAMTGPLPAPVVLKDYDAIIPGLAGRIVAMAEKESAHRQAFEVRAVDAQIEDMRTARKLGERAQHYAFAVVMTALFVSGFCAYMKESTAASVIGGASVVGLATAFLGGKIFGRKVEEQKSPEEEKKTN